MASDDFRTPADETDEMPAIEDVPEFPLDEDEDEDDLDASIDDDDDDDDDEDDEDFDDEGDDLGLSSDEPPDDV